MTDRRALRIGDTERDAAVMSLGEHFAAGRLTKGEYDERTAAAWAARYDADLVPLFDDLPGAARQSETVVDVGRAPWAPWSRARRVIWLAPVVMFMAMAAMVLIVGAMPWLLLGLFWFWVVGALRHRPGRQRCSQPHHGVGRMHGRH